MPACSWRPCCRASPTTARDSTRCSQPPEKPAPASSTPARCGSTQPFVSGFCRCSTRDSRTSPRAIAARMPAAGRPPERMLLRWRAVSGRYNGGTASRYGECRSDTRSTPRRRSGVWNWQQRLAGNLATLTVARTPCSDRPGLEVSRRMARMSGNIGRVMLLAATAGTGCRDLAQAPNPPPIVGESAFRTFLLDHEFNVDYGAGFARPTVLFEGPSSISIVYGDFDQGTVKYAGCASSCGDTTSWHLGVVDSSGYDPTTVLTTTGLHTVYSRAVNTTLKLEYTYCPGGCMVSRH